MIYALLFGLYVLSCGHLVLAGITLADRQAAWGVRVLGCLWFGASAAACLAVVWLL